MSTPPMACLALVHFASARYGITYNAALKVNLGDKT